ncbi:hypothetical protein Pan54_50000 [Rubinisphaera italica]|uniref:Phage major tail protein 2 n=1 Tax=Rubinisphaera italica TaxID=2527969 RepID=A0A5C5XNW1_9PLAN|nr:hypothetical protein Pan54_50000 [Rubinisphaera italica]
MAIKAKGTTLSVEFATDTYTVIGEVKSITGPSFGEVSTPESTHLTSAAREYIAGMTGGGTLSFDLHFDPDNASHSALSDLVINPAVVGFKVTFADATPAIYSFDGILKNFDISVSSFDDLLSASCSVQISGLITKA